MGKYSRKIYWAVQDLLLINFALILSLILRFGQDWVSYFYQLTGLCVYFSISYIIFAILFKLYNRLWRYISINDLFLITKTVTLGMVISILYLNLVMRISTDVRRLFIYKDKHMKGKSCPIQIGFVLK